jgi:uncharacterized membrane protein
MNINITVSLLVFTASVLLSLVVVPSPLSVLPYFVFFGPFAVVKKTIEIYSAKIIAKTGKGSMKNDRRNTIILSYVFKTLILAVLATLGAFIFGEALFAGIKLPAFAPVLLILCGAVIYYCYDYILGLINILITRYVKRR